MNRFAVIVTLVVLVLLAAPIVGGAIVHGMEKWRR